MEERLGGMVPMLVTVFLSGFAVFLMKPVMIDVTVAAVCSDPNDTCSFAVYLTGVQQVVVGLGAMIMMPVIGNLADIYGIKTTLTFPLCLSIIPPAILGYRRDTTFFYAFYIIKILFDMVCLSAVDCLAQAYVAKNIHDRKRISMFGILAGIKSLSGICATFTARILPVASIFQVSAISFLVGAVYMSIYLKEKLQSDGKEDSYEDSDDLMMLGEPILQDPCPILENKYSSLKDMLSLMKNSTILVQVSAIMFLSIFAMSGMDSALMYFLKARFGFNKNDFAELFLLVSVIASISQLFLLPILVSTIGERWMLSTGLLTEVLNAAIVSVSWAAWVPYAATALVPGVMLIGPSVCAISSRQVGSTEQGKVQGWLSAIKSFAEVVAPFVYSPLTALFLSENAPFYFPGFSLLCVALSMMLGFIVSLLIKDIPSTSLKNEIRNSSDEEA